MRARAFDNTKMMAAFLAEQPIARHGEVEDIARAMRYFAHASRHGVTGQLLTVDGGNTLRSSIDYRTSSPCPIKEISHGPRTEDH